METIPTLPVLLPRPVKVETYRKPLEAFIDDSIVIIVGNKQGLKTRKGVDLYKQCRVFTAFTLKPGTKKQEQVFKERPTVDHLWISNKCSRWNKALCIPDIFAIGRIQWYQRKDGSRDLTIVPVDYKTHVENLFLGIVFLYGLHLIEEAKNLSGRGIVTKNYDHWEAQLVWLRLVTEKFKETIEEKKIELGKPNMLKYIDCFLTEITKRTKKARNHVKKISGKKGFQIQTLKYI